MLIIILVERESHHSLWTLENQDRNVVSELIKYGVNVRLIRKDGPSPLFQASQRGDTSMAHVQIAVGTRVDDGSLHQEAREVILILLLYCCLPDMTLIRCLQLTRECSALAEVYLCANCSTSSALIVLKSMFYRFVLDDRTNFAQKCNESALFMLLITSGHLLK